MSDVHLNFRQSCSCNTQLLKTRNRWRIKFDCGCISNTRCSLNLGCLSHRTQFVEKVNKGFQCTKNQVLPHIVTSNSQITEMNKYFANLTEFLKSLNNQRPLFTVFFIPLILWIHCTGQSLEHIFCRLTCVCFNFEKLIIV